MYFSTLTDKLWIRTDELVVEALVVAFAVVMRGELGRCATNRAFAKQNQSLQARLLYRAYKSLRVCVGLSLQIRRMAPLKVDVSE